MGVKVLMQWTVFCIILVIVKTTSALNTTTPANTAASAIRTTVTTTVNTTTPSATTSPTIAAPTTAASPTAASTTATGPTTPKPTTPAYEPSVIITVSFTFSWAQLCRHIENFQKGLAEVLFENKNGIPYKIDYKRIHIIDSECHNGGFTRSAEEAQLKFYVTEKGSDKVDKEMTTKAYELLDNYVKNNKMRELVKEFEGKVKSVSIGGPDAPTPKTEPLFNENERIGIGIGVALIIVLIVTVICVCRASTKKKNSGQSRLHQLENEDQMPIDSPDGPTSNGKRTRTEEVQLTEISRENNLEANASSAIEDKKEEICPLAESEKSSIVELEMGKITEDVRGTENPAFFAEENETEPVESIVQNAAIVTREEKAENTEKYVTEQETKEKEKVGEIEKETVAIVGEKKKDEEEKEKQEKENVEPAASNLGFEDKEEEEEDTKL
ncbi:uncharacterized protein DDB_G0290587-like [Actinia tenebrosa]|uniref:Uncharacterized protein DDB_G0290587-like n=1 Tax=Actinia tenebrosa TaxID=6105 RepID=A0A6P8H9N7_ACTTE|nr:uncharacterized protein DDB_G0290587-like [Actinia tenebrosa]